MIKKISIFSVLLLSLATTIRAEEKFTLKAPHLASVLAVDLKTGKEILSFEPEEGRIPASTLKLLTTIATLKEAGTEHSFTTRFYNQGKVLVVKGGGDPTLVREDLWIIAHRLKEKGLKAVQKICIDDSLYEAKSTRSGARAYYASASPLSVDYNASDIRAGDEAIYRSVGDPFENFITLFAAILTEVGIKVENKGNVCKVKANGEPIYVFSGKPLRQIVELMNSYSTNMIAESLAYFLGDNGDYWSREKGLKAIRNIAVSDVANIVDGSGLSKDNRITARDLINALRIGFESKDFNYEFLASLPVGGKRGTIKKRSSILNNVMIRAKSGSLDGVISLAGYIVTKKEQTVAFSILQNEVRNTNRAFEIEEDVLSYIYNNF